MRSVLAWRTSSASEIRQNVVAGLVVAVIALPLSIALAVAVGVSPVAGLYTAAFAGAVAAIFGGSPYNITGPTAALVPVLNHAVAQHGPGVLPTLAFVAALMLAGLAALRAGRLVRFIPGVVIVGFTLGIALSIAFGQLNNFLGVSGVDTTREHFHEKAWETLTHINSTGLATAAVGTLTLLLLVAWPRLPRLSAIPAPLVAVTSATALTWGLHLDVATVGTMYGSLPRDVPLPNVDFLDVRLILEILPLAAAVAVLAGLESLLSAVVADGMSGTSVRHEPNRELRGQAAGNLAAALFGGIPATAAIARTAAGIRHGATNRIAGVTHAVVVLVATIALGTLASHIPLTALAAVLLVIGWNIAEVPEVAHLVRKAPREDAAILLATAAITVAFDLTYAIGFGVLASLTLLLRRLIAIPAVEELLPDGTGRIRQVSDELAELIKSRPDIAFFSVEGVLSFHSAAAFEYELSGNGRNPLILRMKDVNHIDTTGLLTLEGIIEHRQRHGGRIILTAVQRDLYPVLERFGIVALLGPENLYQHTRCAVASIDAPDGHSLHPSMIESDVPLSVA